MLNPPEVHYADSRGVALAYQLIGDGPVDLIEVAGMFTHLEVKWEEPGLVRWIAETSRFARLILFDRHGIGLSDRLVSDEAPSVEAQVEDLRAVLDAVGSREAVVLGVGDGGPVAAAFAARYPERTRALVLYNSAAVTMGRGRPADSAIEAIVATARSLWGSGIMAGMLGVEELQLYFARAERRACTPNAAATMLRARYHVDLTDLLPTIQAPTLVMHYRCHPRIPSDAARTDAARIPGARFVEMEGYSADALLRERRGLAVAIEEFLTGQVSAGDHDTALAAVVFSDIVGSTERAAELGDRRWRDLVDEYERRTERAVEAARGRIVRRTGDGVLVRFDGAARAVRCAKILVTDSKRMGFAVRVGVHVGECELRGEEIGGITVNVAARVMALAAPHEVLATCTVREALLGTPIQFEDHGTRALRGFPGRWTLYRIRQDP